MRRLDSPEEFHPIVADELELLDRISSALAGLAPRSRAAEAPLERELEELREALLERSEGVDAAALRQQWHRHLALLRQLRASAAAPQVDPASPYFAHMRLGDSAGERDLCLGRASCVEAGLRIVDWRNAPISRLFYRYRQGEAYEEEFGGRTQVGEILVRRGVEIRAGRLEAVEAPEGRFRAGPQGWRQLGREAPRLAGGEARAVRAHGLDRAGQGGLGVGPDQGPQRADKRLSEITGLIDPAQFDLITRPARGFLAIRGSAGSGKTTVALHRIAYLAFEYPELDSERTLFVALSPALRGYVSHVLPALGVGRVRVHTYPEWALRQRRRHYPKLGLGTREDTPAWVGRIKLHPGIGVALAEQVDHHPGPATPEQALDDWASVLTHRALLETCVGGPEIQRFCEWSTRRNEEVFAQLAGDAEAGAELDPEDDTLLLRAWQLRVGPLRQRGERPLRYRHVAVDEVQDFSPVELQVLLDCLDEQRSLTLAGDTQQRLGSDERFASWGELLAGLGVPGREVETLRVSYRSTREIMSFARSLLGELAEDEAPQAPRRGPPVETFRFTDAGACVAFLADALGALGDDEPLASVAVLTPDSDSSELYHRGLSACDLAQLRRVEHQDFSFAPGIEVTEIEQARGLEFDYVVLVDVSDRHFSATPAGRRLLHVGATRAVHQLWITSTGTPSPLLAELGASG